MSKENWYVLIDDDKHHFSVVGPALDDTEILPRWAHAWDEQRRNVRIYGVRNTETREQVMAHAAKLGYKFSQEVAF